MTFSARTLQWLDMQGYQLSDEEKRRLTLPLKFPLVLCTAFGAAFVANAWAPGLGGLAVLAFLGALLPRHPFDYVYGWVVNPLLRTGWAPLKPPQQRFSCAVASVMLGTIASAFVLDYGLLAWSLGAAFVALATIPTLTNWRLPSYLYNALAASCGRAATR